MEFMKLAQIAVNLAQREKGRSNKDVGSSMTSLIFTCIAEFFIEVDKDQRASATEEKSE